MNSYRSLRWLALSVLFMALVGCEANNDVEYAYPQLDIKFAPSASQQTLNVTRVKITIEGSDLEPIELPVEAGERRMDVNFLIPLDAAGISVEAYEVDVSGQERLALKGVSSIEDLTQPAPKITVWLDPVTARLKLEASKTDIAVNELFTIEVLAADVIDLFAMALELDFDSQLLEPTNVSAGSLLGEDPIMFDDLGLGGPAHRLGIAVAMRGGETGVNGSGTVAVVSFRAKAAGTAAIRVAGRTESKDFALQQPGGEPIADFERLVEFLIRAEVTVNIR